MRGLVPEAVRLRPGKSYFNALLVVCLAVHDRELITRPLAGPNAEVLAVADPADVRAHLEGIPCAAPAERWRLDTGHVAAPDG
jgi:hypothetical protein